MEILHKTDLSDLKYFNSINCVSLSYDPTYSFAGRLIVVRPTAASLQGVSSQSVLADIIAVGRPHQHEGVGGTLQRGAGQQGHPAPVATSEAPGPQGAEPGVEGGGGTGRVEISRIDGGSLQSVSFRLTTILVGPEFKCRYRLAGNKTNTLPSTHTKIINFHSF